MLCRLRKRLVPQLTIFKGRVTPIWHKVMTPRAVLHGSNQPGLKALRQPAGAAGDAVSSRLHAGEMSVCHVASGRAGPELLLLVHALGKAP